VSTLQFRCRPGEGGDDSGEASFTIK